MLHKSRLERQVCSELFHKNSSSDLESGKKKGIKEQESKDPWTYISSHGRKGIVSMKVRGQLFIARGAKKDEN
jgi:hypothetical protein